MEMVMWMLIVVNVICMGLMGLCGVTFSVAMVWFATMFVAVCFIAAGVGIEDKSLD